MESDRVPLWDFISFSSKIYIMMPPQAAEISLLQGWIGGDNHPQGNKMAPKGRIFSMLLEYYWEKHTKAPRRGKISFKKRLQYNIVCLNFTLGERFILYFFTLSGLINQFP